MKIEKIEDDFQVKITMDSEEVETLERELCKDGNPKTTNLWTLLNDVLHEK